MYNKTDINTTEIDNKNPSGLYIVATPIGNKYDISLRAIDILKKATHMICEDTRVTKNLFKVLGLDIKQKTWISYNDHNASKKIINLVKIIKKGNISVLVSDAGTPLISDPGYKLVKALKQDNFYITVIPGPCSAISSLVMSGLKNDKFSFIGFLPKNRNNYVKTIRKFATLNSTLIIFEKPSRLPELLSAIKTNFKSYKIVIVNELTKLYEKIIYVDENNINEVTNSIDKLKGEATVIIEFNRSLKKNTFSDTLLLKELKKFKPSQVATMLSSKSSESREIIYKRCIILLKKNDK